MSDKIRITVAEGTLVLDPEDPFEKLLIPIVEMNRRKRADYADDTDIYANFRKNAVSMDLRGYDALEDCKSMVTRKINRINNLRGRDPRNESVLDSFLDAAVYSILLYGLAMEAAE